MGPTRGADEVRDGVRLTSLDQPAFDGATVTKRQLVDYLDAVHTRLLPQLRGRPLSVVRARPGQPPFMQKNVPAYAPAWLPTVAVWADASQREVRYALCEDRRSLLWFANQRAVEYHPALVTAAHPDRQPHLVIDLDPEADGFRQAVRAAGVVREALAGAGLTAAVKTSGGKGLHVVAPVAEPAPVDEVAAATRAVAARAEQLDPALVTTEYLRQHRGGRVLLDTGRAGGATVVAAYSPRARPGAPVSFPVSWEDLDRVEPGAFTVATAAGLLADRDPWVAALPAPQPLPADLVAQGREIPVARARAMHEGKRRARTRRAGDAPAS